MVDLMTTTWWAWAIFALVLAVIEVLAPGFVFLGFAIGAGAVSLLLLVLGAFTGPAGLLLVFAILSGIGWFFLRKFFRHPAGEPKTFDHDVND